MSLCDFEFRIHTELVTTWSSVGWANPANATFLGDHKHERTSEKIGLILRAILGRAVPSARKMTSSKREVQVLWRSTRVCRSYPASPSIPLKPLGLPSSVTPRLPLPRYSHRSLPSSRSLHPPLIPFPSFLPRLPSRPWRNVTHHVCLRPEIGNQGHSG